MKFTCETKALLAALAHTASVTGARTPKPVLGCVKIIAEAGRLTLAATDNEVSVRVSTPRVEVQEPGEALIPADKLFQIVRESTGPTLAVESENDKAVIRGQDSRFDLNGYPPAELPPIAEFAGEGDFTIQAGDLHRLITQTIFATANENSRYAINGVLIERQGNKLTFVATDGRRLALAKGICKPGNDDRATISAIVPTKALNLLVKLFTVPEKPVTVRIADNQAVFAGDDAVLSSKLVEGNFPQYKDVIPKDGDKKATLATAAFASAVRRAALLTADESKGIRLSFKGKTLTLTSRAPEMGEAEINIEVPQYVGEPLDVGFNPQFLLDALKIADSEQVTLDMKAGNKPGVIRVGADFLYVVMPVNLV